MKKRYEDVKELIGQTPMLRLKRMGTPKNIKLFAKLEFLIPVAV